MKSATTILRIDRSNQLNDPWDHMGVSVTMGGTAIAGWCMLRKIPLKWDETMGGTP